MGGLMWQQPLTEKVFGHPATWWEYATFNLGYYVGLGLCFYLIFLGMRWLTRTGVRIYDRFKGP